MNETALLRILESMKEITYSDWQKLKMCIDTYFASEASKQMNTISFAGSDQVLSEYKHYSPRI